MDDDAALERGEAIIAALAVNERRISALQAEQVQLLAELATVMPKKPSETYGEFVPDEVAVALTWSSNTAARRLHHAVELTTRLPQLLDALSTGELDLWRTEVVFDAVRKLPDEVATQVCDHALAAGLDRPVGLLKRLVRKAVLTYDPDGQQKRHREAREERRVSFQPLDDGMAELAAYLPAHEAVLIDRRLDAFAHQSAPDDPRTVDQRRADAFRDLMLSPAMGPIITKVHLTVPAATVTGATALPGELARYGSLDATQSRELAIGYTNLEEPTTSEAAPGYGRKLAADPTWRRLLTDPTSEQLLDYGARTYKPPAALAGYVRARDPHCVFPGCTRPSQTCDLDHRIPYPAGHTSADNLAPLCRHHHRLKHQGGWTLLKHGTHYTWLTPAQTAAARVNTSGAPSNALTNSRAPNGPTTPTTVAAAGGPDRAIGRSPHTPIDRSTPGGSSRAPIDRINHIAADRRLGPGAASSRPHPTAQATPKPPVRGPRTGRRPATYRSRAAHLAALRRALVIDGPPRGSGDDPPPF